MVLASRVMENLPLKPVAELVTPEFLAGLRAVQQMLLYFARWEAEWCARRLLAELEDVAGGPMDVPHAAGNATKGLAQPPVGK
jgi:hypothetical protein